MQQSEQLERFQDLSPESQCQNLVSTVFFLPYSLDGSRAVHISATRDLKREPALAGEGTLPLSNPVQIPPPCPTRSVRRASTTPEMHPISNRVHTAASVMDRLPLLSEHGTNNTVEARFRHWLPGRSPSDIFSCSLLAWKRALNPTPEPPPTTNPHGWTTWSIFLPQIASINPRISRVCPSIRLICTGG
jgi:hypothetical protein